MDHPAGKSQGEDPFGKIWSTSQSRRTPGLLPGGQGGTATLGPRLASPPASNAVRSFRFIDVAQLYAGGERDHCTGPPGGKSQNVSSSRTNRLARSCVASAALPMAHGSGVMQMTISPPLLDAPPASHELTAGDCAHFTTYLPTSSCCWH